jgi:hypothetical protein
MLKVTNKYHKHTIDFMNNNFKHLIEEPITGLKIMCGPYSIHLLEGESSAVKKVLKNLDAHMHGPTPFYSSAWVLHSVDEQPNRVFNHWFCKTVIPQGNGKEIKSLTSQMEKSWTIYDGMSEIGRQLTAKGYSPQVTQASQL